MHKWNNLQNCLKIQIWVLLSSSMYKSSSEPHYKSYTGGLRKTFSGDKIAFLYLFEYASVIRTYWIWKYYDNWRDYYEMSEKCYYATQFRFLLIGLDFTFLHNLQIIRYMMDQKNTFGKYKRTHLHNPLVKPNK